MFKEFVDAKALATRLEEQLKQANQKGGVSYIAIIVILIIVIVLLL